MQGCVKSTNLSVDTRTGKNV